MLVFYRFMPEGRSVASISILFIVIMLLNLAKVIEVIIGRELCASMLLDHLLRRHYMLSELCFRISSVNSQRHNEVQIFLLNILMVAMSFPIVQVLSTGFKRFKLSLAKNLGTMVRCHYLILMHDRWSCWLRYLI